MKSELLAVSIILFLSSCRSSSYNLYCAENKSYTKLEPSDPVIKGRYVLELCTTLNLTLQYLSTHLSVDSRPADACIKYDARKDRALMHSIFSYDVSNDTNINCSNVCFNTTVDLVYSGCYTIKTEFRGHHRTPPKIGVLHISNNLNATYFAGSVTFISGDSFNDDYHLKMHFGSVPVTQFELEVCHNTACNTSIDSVETCQSVEDKCQVRNPHFVECTIPHLASGPYNLYLTHKAPWVQGDIFNTDRLARATWKFVHQASQAQPEVWTRDSAQSWVLQVCGVTLLVAVCVGAGLRWREVVRRRQRQLLTKGNWVQSTEQESVSNVVMAPNKDILLLYARDCEPFMDAMRILREILEESTKARVYDLFCPETQAAMLPSPEQWLRTALQARMLRVLFLETYTAQQLYSCNIANSRDGLALVEPLLPSRVVYRQPQYQDALVHVVLGRLRDKAHESGVYHEYYLATLSSMPASVLASVVPHRRYLLPEHVGELVRALSPTAPAPASTTAPAPDRLPTLELALHRFTQHVQHNPDYLQDELIFL